MKYLWAGLLGLVLSACSSDPIYSGPFNRAAPLPAFPGATDVSYTEDGDDTRVTFFVNASLEDVYAFFHGGLTGSGWQRTDLEAEPSEIEADYAQGAQVLEFELEVALDGVFELEVDPGGDNAAFDEDNGSGDDDDDNGDDNSGDDSGDDGSDDNGGDGSGDDSSGDDGSGDDSGGDDNGEDDSGGNGGSGNGGDSGGGNSGGDDNGGSDGGEDDGSDDDGDNSGPGGGSDGGGGDEENDSDDDGSSGGDEDESGEDD